MIIKLHGETSISKVSKILKEVIQNTQARAGLEESKYTVKDLEVGVLFTVNGEKMMLSIEHDGVKEPFTVHVELDEKGNIKSNKDNEEESFLDEYSKAVAKGLESPITKEIKSEYKDELLVEIARTDAGELVEVVYKEIITGDKVIRYYRNNVLIGEIGQEEREA